MNDFYVGQKVIWRRADGEDRELEVISVGESSIAATDGQHAWQFGDYGFCASPIYALAPVPPPRTKLFSGTWQERIGMAVFLAMVAVGLVFVMIRVITGWGVGLNGWILGIFWGTLLLLHPALAIGEWLFKKARTLIRRKRVAS